MDRQNRCYRVEFTKDAQKALGKVDRKTMQRLYTAICKLPKGDVKRVEGKSGLWRLTVGGRRVIFSYGAVDLDGTVVIVVERIEPRGQIYKHLGGL